MTSARYLDGIRRAYTGELIGEGTYRELATRCSDPDRQSKLAAIADVERLTHERLKPIALRHGIAVADSTWRPIVERRVEELASLSWLDFMDMASRDWPPYILRFEALRQIAPACDIDTIQMLVDHEVALVEFVHLERSGSGSARSLRPLHIYLGR